MPSFELEGNLFTQWHQITSLETRDSRLSYYDAISPDLESVPGRDGQTDGQTDGRTEFPWLIRTLSSTCRYSCGA